MVHPVLVAAMWICPDIFGGGFLAALEIIFDSASLAAAMVVTSAAQHTFVVVIWALSSLSLEALQQAAGYLV